TAYITLNLITNSMYVHQGLMGTYQGSGWLDSLFILQYMVGGVAAFVQMHIVASTSRSHSPVKQRPGIFKFHLPYIWLSFPVALLILNRHQAMVISSFGLILGAGGVLVLLVARQALWWSENARLYDQLESELAQRKRAEEALRLEQLTLENRVHW